MIQVAPDLFSLRDNQTQWGHNTLLSLFGIWLRCFLFFLFGSTMGRRTCYWPDIHSYCSGAKSELTRNIVSTCFWPNLAALMCDSSCSKNKIPLLWLSFFWFSVHHLFTISTDLATLPLLLSHILILGLPPFGSKPLLCDRNKHTEPAQVFSFRKWSLQRCKCWCSFYFLRLLN